MTEDVTYTATFQSDWAALAAQFETASTDGDHPTVITLSKDYFAAPEDTALLIRADRYVTLDLNGHILNRNLSEATNNGYVIMVNGTLTIIDSAPSATHSGTEITGGMITGGNCSGSAGGVYVRGGTLVMNGGSIAGNSAKYNGGVCVARDARFTLTNGKIIDNTATKDNGGGVGLYDGCVFTMSGGAILDNVSADYAGGVYVKKGTFNMSDGAICGNKSNGTAGGGVVVDDGTFDMSGGSIAGNTAVHGGGVFMTGGRFNMTGGSIAGNTAVYGGGVYRGDGTFNISGSPVITGNTKSSDGTANNVFLGEGKLIIVTGPLTGAACIGVSTPNAPATDNPIVLTSGLSGNGSEANFISDRVSCGVYLNGDGEAALGAAYTVYLDSGITHGAVASDKASAVEGQTVTLTVTPEEGYMLDSLTVTDGNGNEVTVTNGSFTMPACDVTVTAAFTAAPVVNKYDVDRNGTVNITDVTTLLNGLSTAVDYNALFDLNDDGVSNITDVTVLLDVLSRN